MRSCIVLNGNVKSVESVRYVNILLRDNDTETVFRKLFMFILSFAHLVSPNSHFLIKFAHIWQKKQQLKKNETNVDVSSFLVATKNCIIHSNCII